MPIFLALINALRSDGQSRCSEGYGDDHGPAPETRKDLETDGGHSEEINGNELREVVLEEGAPSLRRRLKTMHHVFADVGLTDVDAELKKFTVNAWRTPSGILATHPADQISNVTRNDWATGLAVANLPSPE